MTSAGSIAASLRRSDQGTAVTEFGLIAPVMCALLLGFLDFAHAAYVRSIAAGAIEQVARSTSVGETTVNSRAFEQEVEASVKVVAADATFAWQKKSYYQFSGIGKPEKLTDDKDGDKAYDAGDCWEDLNGDGDYDTSPGRDGIGGADDVVFYQLTVTHPALIPMSGLLPGVSDTRSTVIKTIVKRQPFAAQAVPQIRC